MVRRAKCSRTPRSSPPTSEPSTTTAPVPTTPPIQRSPPMLLELRDIQVHYGRVEALRGVTVEVDAGEIVTLIGANGAGKTTTLKTVSGVRKLSRGQVFFDGHDISTESAHKRVQLGICQSPEGRAIFP